MFQRRMFSSSGIPRSMYRSLHIQTASQATRMLPSLISIPTSLCNVPQNVGILAAMDGQRLCPSLSMDAMLDELLGLTISEASTMATVWCKRNLTALQSLKLTLPQRVSA